MGTINMTVEGVSCQATEGRGQLTLEDRSTAASSESSQSQRAVHVAVLRHTDWLERFGETSYDNQSFFSGPIGGRAKQLYYRRPIIGTLAVSPMIFLEACLPEGRRLFWKKQRFPIADAHYAMGNALLAMRTGEERFYGRARHFLTILEQTRCAGYRNFAWGYPFAWVTRNGVIAADTPLITSTPYAYEAFDYVYRIDGDSRWLEIMRSIAEHALLDFNDREVAAGSAAVGYFPGDREGSVVNASAYRAFLLLSAARRFGRAEFARTAERNLNFVLGAQLENGSWRYAEDGVRDFVDHFHTCFVLKSLAKIEALGARGTTDAINRGVRFYVDNLFDEQGLPRPFARPPRLTVYRHELYDYAECINLGATLRGRIADLDTRVQGTITDLMSRWIKPDGSFRSRRLMMGWDNVPMHRWAQAQVFRSLCAMLVALECPTQAPWSRDSLSGLPGVDGTGGHHRVLS